LLAKVANDQGGTQLLLDPQGMPSEYGRELTVVVGPDGLSRFEELSRREAARTAILYAFDSIEHDGEDLRNLPFLDRKSALTQLLRNTDAGKGRQPNWPAASSRGSVVGSAGVLRRTFSLGFSSICPPPKAATAVSSVGTRSTT
jgi:hypothetical protein